MMRPSIAMLVSLAVPAPALAPVLEPLPPPIELMAAPPPLPPSASRAPQAILDFIRRVNPDVPVARATRLAATIAEVSAARGLDPLLLTGIIAQESHFHADVQACHAFGCDLGVAQIHWETWAGWLKLDRHRLIHDDDYNILMAGEILVDLRTRFGVEGPAWWTRYHDPRPEQRAEYAQRVRSHAPMLLGSL